MSFQTPSSRSSIRFSELSDLNRFSSKSLPFLKSSASSSISGTVSASAVSIGRNMAAMKAPNLPNFCSWSNRAE